MQPIAAAALPFDQDLAGRLVHPLDVKRVLFGEVRFGEVPTGLQRALVQRDGFRFLAELPLERLSHERHVDAEQLRQNAVINHVADKSAQLGVGANRRDELIEGHRIEGQVGTQRVELQGLVVNDGGTRFERHDVFLRRLRVHGDEEVDFLLTPDVPALAGPDGVPRRQPRDVRREHVLARNRESPSAG